MSTARIRMPTEDLAKQDDTFLDDYISYYNIPADFDRNQVVPMLCSARSTIPVLAHLTYEQLDNGFIHFTGRVASTDKSKQSGLSESGPSQPATQTALPSGSRPTAGSQNASNNSTFPGRNIKPAPGRQLKRGSLTFLAWWENQQRLEQKESDDAWLAAQQAKAASSSKKTPAVAKKPMFPGFPGMNLIPAPGRALKRGSLQFLAWWENKQRAEQKESDDAWLAAQQVQAADVPPVFPAMNLEPASGHELVRGSTIRRPLMEAGDQLPGGALNFAVLDAQTIATAPVTGPRSPPPTPPVVAAAAPAALPRPPPSPRMLPNIHLANNLHPMPSPPRPTTPGSPSDVALKHRRARRYRSPTPFVRNPEPSPIASASSQGTTSPQTNVPQPSKPSVLIPFPRMEDSPFRDSDSLPDFLHPSPEQKPEADQGPRFVYPPVIKGDWMDTMLEEVVSGRKTLKAGLEDAKQLVRLAVEEVMKAQMEAQEEEEEWAGFKAYLREIVGEDWMDEIQKAVKNMEEFGSDYEGSDDDNNEGGDDSNGGPGPSGGGGDSGGDDSQSGGGGGDSGGDDSQSGGGGGVNGGSHLDYGDDALFGSGGDSPSDAHNQPPNEGSNGGGNDGERPNDRDNSSDPKSDPRSNHLSRQRSDFSPAPYETPSQPSKAPTRKRARDTAQDEDSDLFSTMHKRPKSSPSPSPSGSDFIPSVLHPATPRPKRRRSQSLDSEEEVERSIRKEANLESLDQDEAPTRSPFKKFRPALSEDEAGPVEEAPTSSLSSMHQELQEQARDNTVEADIFVAPPLNSTASLFEPEEEDEEVPSNAGWYYGQAEEYQDVEGETYEAQDYNAQHQGVVPATFYDYLGSLWQSPSSVPQPQPSFSTAASPQPFNTPMPPSPPIAGPSGANAASAGSPQPPYVSRDSSVDRIPGPSMPDYLNRPRPLYHDRERITSDNNGGATSYQYDEDPDYKWRQERYAHMMRELGIEEAPPKYEEEYAEIRGMVPRAPYTFSNE